MRITAAILVPLPAKRRRRGKARPLAQHHAQLGCQASWYRDNLARCSDAMLQYEWAWMKDRLTALLRCRAAAQAAVRPGTQAGASSPPPAEARRCPQEGELKRLLGESQLCHRLLRQEFACRGLRPLPPRGPVVASEEAWEITSSSVRQAWGIGG
jgi:hypothetical protein